MSNFPIKFLKKGNEPFLPVTSAEAVMVKHVTGVRRLDDVLRLKIEEVVTPAGSGLSSFRVDGGVTIVHSNNIEPSLDTLLPKLIKYDNRGHIVETADFESLIVGVNGARYGSYDGSASSFINLGDDFMDNNGQIQIRWNTIT